MSVKKAAGSARKLVKVEKPVLFEFDEIGKIAAGTILGITEGETQYGTARFLQMLSDDGDKFSVCISASLNLVDWEDLEGLYCEIEYTGEEKSKKNKGKTFKTFEIRHEQIEE